MDTPKRIKNSTVKENTAVWLLIILGTLWFTLFSPQHPMKQWDSTTDSSVFRTVAMMMRHGAIPYRDTFDHKGPLLYLLNWVGACINEMWGIWLVEVVFLAVTFFITYKTARLFTQMGEAVLVVLLTAGVLWEYCDMGNMSEEYAMPFIAGAIYIFVDFLKNGRVSRKRLVMCGMALSAVLLLRPNMIAIWVVFCIQIFFSNVMEKKWKTLGNFVLWFIIGVVIVAAPVLIWLGMNGALEAFWKAYIVFNSLYSTNRGIQQQLIALFHYAATPTAILSMFGLWYFSDEESRVLNRTYFAAIMLSMIMTAISGRLYGHYGIQNIPLFAYPLARVLEKTRSWRTAKTKATNVVVLIGLACMLLLPDWAAMQQENYQTQSGNDPEETKQKVIQLIEENSTPEDTISVYGNWDIIYLRTGRRHATRFSYQLPIGKISPEIMQEYVEEIEEERPAVVVIAEDTESALLRETLLRCRYKLLWKQENDGVEVYKR